MSLFGAYNFSLKDIIYSLKFHVLLTGKQNQILRKARPEEQICDVLVQEVPGNDPQIYENIPPGKPREATGNAACRPGHMCLAFR